MPKNCWLHLWLMIKASIRMITFVNSTIYYYSRFDSQSANTRPSSSSIAESWTTQSSGFESSHDNFDLNMSSASDNLDTIMDDLFVPEGDIDLSLYGDWSAAGNHGDYDGNTKVKSKADDEVSEGPFCKPNVIFLWHSFQ